MNEQTSAGEGNPAVEQAERQALGNENYQKAEVVHRFADTHAWFHPALVVGSVGLIIIVILALCRFNKSRA